MNMLFGNTGQCKRTSSFLSFPSHRVLLPGFFALVLCGVMVFLSQYETAEKQTELLSKRSSSQRKLQAVEVNKTSKKNVSTKILGEKSKEKRATTTKYRVDYKAIIKELLNDNRQLQQKLNETLQALDRCIHQDSSDCKMQEKKCPKISSDDDQQKERKDNEINILNDDKKKIAKDNIRTQKEKENVNTDASSIDMQNSSKYYHTNQLKMSTKPSFIHTTIDKIAFNKDLSKQDNTLKKDLNETIDNV